MEGLLLNKYIHSIIFIYHLKVILLTNKWRLVGTEMYKPIYRKQDNFLHCYVEKSSNEPSQKEDYQDLILQENINWLKLSPGSEPLFEFKSLIDFFNLTFKKSRSLQNIRSKNQSLQDTISLAVQWRLNSGPDRGIDRKNYFLTLNRQHQRDTLSLQNTSKLTNKSKDFKF